MSAHFDLIVDRQLGDFVCKFRDGVCFGGNVELPFQRPPILPGDDDGSGDGDKSSAAPPIAANRSAAFMVSQPRTAITDPIMGQSPGRCLGSTV
jgi:hypothetical protein